MFDCQQTTHAGEAALIAIRSHLRVNLQDGNGKISQDELRQVLGMPNVQGAVGSETIAALLSEVDLNGDGEASRAISLELQASTR